jgi:hypothetical protein
MGSGKSSFIIPLVIFLLKYVINLDKNYNIELIDLHNNPFDKLSNELMIICPNHLVNSMYSFINEFIDLLPKNILIYKYTKNDNYVYNFGQIIICDDYFIKYNLLKNSNLLLENNNRIMFVDEIDSIMDPLTSEFNLMINTSKNIPEKESLFYLIYKIVYEYNNLEHKNIESIRNLIATFSGGLMDIIGVAFGGLLYLLITFIIFMYIYLYTYI